jgi:hypothetical protein
MVLHSKLHHGLFDVQESLAHNKAQALVTKDILHKRYGRPGEKAQQQLAAEGKGEAPRNCEICVKAKQPRVTLKPSDSRANCLRNRCTLCTLMSSAR